MLSRILATLFSVIRKCISSLCGKNLDVKLNNWKTSELSRIQLHPQSKTLETGLVSGINNVCLGSALHSHCRGQEFESPMLHHIPSENTVFGRIFCVVHTKIACLWPEIAKKGGASPSGFRDFLDFWHSDSAVAFDELILKETDIVPRLPPSE